MSMQKQSDKQILPLTGMEQGQWMTVIITEVVTGGPTVTLEFRNAGSDNWTPHPDFNGALLGGICVQRVQCFSAHMRLNFSSDPVGNPYWVGIVWDAKPTF